MTDVEALVERLKGDLRNLDPAVHGEDLAAATEMALDDLDSLTSALERTERERDEAWELLGEDAGAEWFNLKARAQKAKAERDEWKAGAFKFDEERRKAEAVVEAARNVAGVRNGAWPELAAALTAYDEPPTEQA
jgi:hypothetical protein